MVAADQEFALVDRGGTAVLVQSWSIAFWPDGSLKRSAHALAAPTPAEGYTLKAGTATAAVTPVTITEHEDHLDAEGPNRCQSCSCSTDRCPRLQAVRKRRLSKAGSLA
ncbi:RIFT barrel domain-containing protein [Nonomuraea turcica]|uniref:RIFT barrel domain-containing protein n=1 Tax=Nonomuraea sp. G32 TaxID=3067274 RepID=UPI00273AE8A3|nr:hypothetical protein [Nonomuraea sp. G32]MDP4511577.1 hypothetical protein [Nonomuraea sp. G32]